MPDHDTLSIRLPVAFVDALSQAESIEAVLTAGAQWLPRLIPGVRGSIGFLDGNRLIAQTARSDGVIDPGFDKTRIVAGSPRARVVDTGEPVFLDEYAMRAAGTVPLAMLLDSGIRSLMIAPMLSGGQTVGTLSVGRDTPQGFSQADCQTLVSIGKWIAGQARLMQQIRASARAAETDALTGLANRARLMRVLDGPGALHLPDSEGRIIGVLHIDLDHFKEVNDTLGHAVGDAILRNTAAAMRAATASHDLVARTGGDEFVVVTRTDPEGQHIAQLGRDLVARIGRPVRIGAAEARVGASIGTAMANRQDRTADRLIGNADIALYEVKRNGRGGVCAFTDDMRARSESRQRLLADLKAAIETRQFEPYFQPQVWMATGRFSGFEMLARWPHPKMGVLAPEDFLDLAAEAGVMEQIDGIVRAKGLATLRGLRSSGWHAPKMSFNASARTLCDPDLVDSLLWEVLGQGLAATDLVIEIRETHLTAEQDGIAARNIAALAQAGFAVELDDFGTGHAAMSTLATLAISGVKLDRSMIAPLPDACSEAILRAIIALAGDLNLSVVAKGVETPAQFAQLAQMGCHVAQGYGVSKPLSRDGLVAFMEGYGKAPVALAVS